jgi:hypothetical protein
MQNTYITSILNTPDITYRKLIELYQLVTHAGLHDFLACVATPLTTHAKKHEHSTFFIQTARARYVQKVELLVSTISK